MDKTLYPIIHQIVFQQDNPSKPCRYKLLLNLLNDKPFLHT